MKKILILTAGFGEGHNAAARGLESGMQKIGGAEVSVSVIDLFAITYGAMNEFAKKSYLALINHAPIIWQKIYEMLDHTQSLETNLPALSKMRKRLGQILAEEKPDAVISTYPLYAFLIDQLFQKTTRDFLFATVVTDSITVNTVWHRAPSDFFIVPNEPTARVMRDAKVPPEKIKVLGFPVMPLFAELNARREPPSATNPPRVLFIINFGSADAPALVRRLIKIANLHLTVTVGRDENLRRAVETAVTNSPCPVEIHGWTNEIPRLMSEHHLVLSKAGGATVQESIAARTPMIISQIVPGQEEGNARLIFENDCGALADTHDEIVREIENAFAHDSALWLQWEENISRLSKPDAALQIARFILDELAARPAANRSTPAP